MIMFKRGGHESTTLSEKSWNCYLFIVIVYLIVFAKSGGMDVSVPCFLLFNSLHTHVTEAKSQDLEKKRA